VISLAEAINKGELEANPLQIGLTTYLDLEPPGVFINHSCDPNAGTRGKYDVYSLRDISAGEEVRFDYSTSMSEGRWTMVCSCRASSCRGIVSDFRVLPLSLQKHYLELGIVQPFIVDELKNANGATD